MWLFHLHRTVNIQAFSPVFLLAESTARHLAGYSFGASRKKASAFFCGTAFLSCGGEAANEEVQRPGQQRPFLWRREGGTVAIPAMRLEACPAFLDCFGCAWYVVVSSPPHGEHTGFFSSFPLGGIRSKAFGWLFLWSFKEKTSAFFCGTAIAFQGPEGDKGRRARRKPENMAKSILIPLPKKRSYARKTSAPLSGACLPFSITHYPPYINQRLMRLCRICRPAVRQGS